MHVPQNHHFALSVRAKRLEIPDMVRGKFMIMLMTRDFEDVNRRYKLAQVFLRPLAGEMVVFKIDANDIGKVEVIGAYMVPRKPKMTDVVMAASDIQKAFWRKAGVETGYLSGRTAKAAAPQKKPYLFGWFANA